VAKSKTTLFLDVNAFIPSVKIDFATGTILEAYSLLAWHNIGKE
jgi:hypothetical protein